MWVLSPSAVVNQKSHKPVRAHEDSTENSLAMNKILLPVSGAFLAATLCVSPTLSAEDLTIEKRTTTTTTAPTVVTPPVVVDDDDLEDRVEKQNEAAEELNDEIGDANEEAAEEMEDALDD